jgi:branched-chain amino acid transport system ATP-binding protein
MLRVESLNVAYGSLQVLWEVSLGIDEGEFVALVGANGAGKTTLLRTISGLIPARSGRITFRGGSILELEPHVICQRGLIQVPEGRELFPRMWVRENLELGAYVPQARLRRAESLERVYALFPRLRERERQDAGTLSGGEQQMLAIGRGLMGRPALLMLDEPTLGIAPLLVEQLMAALKRLNAEGLTILLISQEVHQVLELADRAYVLESGRVVREGPAGALRGDPLIKQAYLGL